MTKRRTHPPIDINVTDKELAHNSCALVCSRLKDFRFIRMSGLGENQEG